MPSVEYPKWLVKECDMGYSRKLIKLAKMEYKNLPSGMVMGHAGNEWMPYDGVFVFTASGILLKCGPEMEYMYAVVVYKDATVDRNLIHWDNFCDNFDKAKGLMNLQALNISVFQH